MATFTLATDNQKQTWSDNFITSYVRASTYKPFIGSKNNNIIQMENKLTSEAGVTIHVPLFDKFRGAANDGTTTLTGNELSLSDYSASFTTKLVRQGYAIQITEQLKTELDLFNVHKERLTAYAAELLKNDLMNAFGSIPVVNPAGAGLSDLNVLYSSASTSALNGYVTTNNDRVVFVGGSNTGTMSSSLASVSATAGQLSGAVVSAARDLADATAIGSNFAITPYQTKDGVPWYVLFVDAVGYRQIKSDPVVAATLRDALPREHNSDENPLISGDDFTWDGVIIKKMRDYTPIGNVGASSTPVYQAHLCGINSVLMGYSMKTTPTRRDQTDYQLITGAGFMEQRGQIKTSVGGLQAGMVTLFHA